MKNINIKEIFKSKITGNIIILITSGLLIYLIISLYFINHFFFNTEINGIDLSLKSYHDVEEIIKTSIKDYDLKLIERDGETEEIIGQDIELKYNKNNSISKIYNIQKSFKWINSLLNYQKYYIDDLFIYNKENLENKIQVLNCLNKEIIEPQNASFQYSDGSYKVIKEIYGNKINKDKLYEAIVISILKGKRELDLNESSCYEDPKYILSSNKTFETKNTLNKYVSSKITYMFGSENEILDESKINEWLSVDENLEVVVNEKKVKEYVKELSKKYDTVGVTRKFKTATGEIVEVKGGYYGWKINIDDETEELLKNIKSGSVFDKEPIYAQKALFREEDDIGDTYVEINITKQHLWFYKDGKVITQGNIVTGNPNKGQSTKVGTYMLNYKEKDSTLTGENYEAKVNYWMPFNGNIGIHDASWRYSFGGEIYKRNGSHGCINSPLYLAKTIFENIEEGTPIICYEE